MYVDKQHAWQVTKTIGGKTYGIGTVFLSGAGYVDYPITDLSRESMLGWEDPAWGADLVRSNDFVLNVDDTDFNLVARVEFNIKYINVDDYYVLMAMSKERVVYVTYYNREIGQWEERQEMSFTEKSIEALYAFNTQYIGVLNVSVKLVATNRDKDRKNFTVTINNQIAYKNDGRQYFQFCDCLDLSKLDKNIYNPFNQPFFQEVGTSHIFLKDSLLTITRNLNLIPTSQPQQTQGNNESGGGGGGNTQGGGGGVPEGGMSF